MKNIVKTIINVAIIATLSACQKGPSIPKYEGYELFWHDEFDGETLNEDNWECMIGDGYPNVGWGNQELQYYTKDNVSIRNNQLVITGMREKKGNYNYTSARIRSKGKVYFKYGRIEASIKLPAITGMWPAFWMLPEDSYHNKGWPYNGEIDIMEARGRLNDRYSGAVHYASIGGNDEYQTFVHMLNGEGRNAKEEKTYINEFHLYSLEWDEDELRWYFDNELVGRVVDRAWKRTLEDGTTYSPFDYDFHILLNLAIGGHFDEFREPPEDFTDAEMIVDYVRIYKYKD